MSDRSSTSSSRERLPSGLGHRDVWLALLCTLGALLAWNRFWSDRGFPPSVQDSPALWAATRVLVDDSTTVLLGTSRAQAALDPRVWEQEWPGRRVVNLAVEGNSPARPLHDLAMDARFRGIVVVDFPVFFVFDAEHVHWNARMALAAVGPMTTGPAARWEHDLSTRLWPYFPLRNPSLKPVELLVEFVKWRLPSPPLHMTRPDRMRPLVRDYQVEPPTEKEIGFFRTIGRPATAAERDSIIADFRADVARLHSRGASVVFVRMPTCREVHALEEERYPTRRYWDVARMRIPAPFLDDSVPALRPDRWQCADGSHIDWREATAFTRALVPVIRELLAAGRDGQGGGA